MDPDTPPPPSQPSAFNYILSFLLVGIAWGFTTPFIRRAAVDFNARQAAKQAATESGQPSTTAGTGVGAGAGAGAGTGTTPQTATTRTSWLKTKLVTLFWTVVNLLRTPAYAVPLIVNLTGSIWFFLLVGKHELSLTVPITNSMAFLFTVLGEWYVERKVIERETWIGMFLVLGGIALCVTSKG
ncbi:integral membrane protein [Paecilomyces variotii No. 5]|uniref:Integral membrane protein n=1 Tax=Byssochlamys spectabilis (strain No. 5 / NBRC 109023) TaxID=1356009 RepID=V5I4W4_BYSSN|nr:integral membrane protein [Paecilomyces variotii No. 5]